MVTLSGLRITQRVEAADDAVLDLLVRLDLAESLEAEFVDAFAEDAQDRREQCDRVSAARETAAIAP